MKERQRTIKSILNAGFRRLASFRPASMFCTLDTGAAIKTLIFACSKPLCVILPIEAFPAFKNKMSFN